MTTRNRGRPRARQSRRQGRNVWVNNNVNSVLGISSISILDLLLPAEEFMKFDTTVVSIVVTGLNLAWDAIDDAGTGNRHIAVGFFRGLRTLDAADAPLLLVDSIGAPWMGTLWASTSLTGVQRANLNLTPSGPVQFKAKRRFAENDSTIWMAIQNFSSINDLNIELSGLIRTLIYIP